MAKMEADYQADFIAILNAEIEAQVRDAINLNEVNWTRGWRCAQRR